MDLNESSQQFLQELTGRFINDIISSVQNDAVEAIQANLKQYNMSALLEEQINSIVIPFFTNELQNKLEQDVVKRLSDVDVVTLVNQHLVKVIIPRMETQVKDRIGAEILNKLQTLDVAEMANQYTTKLIRDSVKTMHFPDQSIPGRSIKSDTLSITGDNIEGGIIKKFGSTGIQDNARKCQVTILDQATVFENRLVSRGLEVVGDATFKGNLSIEGDLAENSTFVKKVVGLVSSSFNKDYEKNTFNSFSDKVFERIVDEGIDASVIKIGQNPIVDLDTLDGAIVNSNLQTLGALKELQVVGETLLDQTLFVSGSRVGINTLNPERALDLWDQEIQIVAGKKQQDVAFLGTGRNQTLVIGTNNRDQLTVNTDGSIGVKTINIGKVTHTSGNRMPSDNKPIGNIVWNENPIIGGPIGWVSLGGARWASFGTINS